MDVSLVLQAKGLIKYWESYAAVSIAKASLESLTKYMELNLDYGLKTNLIQAGIPKLPSLKKYWK